MVPRIKNRIIQLTNIFIYLLWSRLFIDFFTFQPNQNLVKIPSVWVQRKQAKPKLYDPILKPTDRNLNDVWFEKVDMHAALNVYRVAIKWLVVLFFSIPDIWLGLQPFQDGTDGTTADYFFTFPNGTRARYFFFELFANTMLNACFPTFWTIAWVTYFGAIVLLAYEQTFAFFVARPMLVRASSGYCWRFRTIATVRDHFWTRRTWSYIKIRKLQATTNECKTTWVFIFIVTCAKKNGFDIK